MATTTNRICILDIETAKTSFKHPERTHLAFAGVKTYSRARGGYRANTYRIYLPHQLEDLGSFLEGFRGIILGYNLLRFDLPVLAHYHVPVDAIIEKVVDLYLVVARLREFATYAEAKSAWRPARGELGLGNLGKVNLRLPKLMRHGSISRAWQHGDRKRVIRYNRRDCAVTFGLWRRLLQEGQLRYRKGCRMTYIHYSDCIVWRHERRLRRIHFKRNFLESTSDVEALMKESRMGLYRPIQEDFAVTMKFKRDAEYLGGRKPEISTALWRGLKPRPPEIQ